MMQMNYLNELYPVYNRGIAVNGGGLVDESLIPQMIPDLIHFLYKNDAGQVVIPAVDKLIYDYHDYYK